MSNKPHNRPKKAKVKTVQQEAPSTAEVFALRRMYEQAVADKQALTASLQQSQTLTAAVLLSVTGEELIVSKETLDYLATGAVDGISIDPNDDEGLVLKIVRAAL